jgi:hypothetical protein
MYSINCNVETVAPDLNPNIEQQSSDRQIQKSPRRELFRRSKRVRERRAIESGEVPLKRMRTDAQRHRLHRQQETQEEKERRRTKDTRCQKSAMPAFEMRNG